MRISTVLLAAACLASLTAAAPRSHDRDPARVGSLDVHPCGGSPTVPLLGECGEIRVPLDWSDRSSGSIRIRFEWLPALRGHASSTLVALDGGPGSPSTNDGRGFSRLFGPLRGDHNLLLMDERGTGGSTPINCAALQELGASPDPGTGAETDRATAQCGYLLNHTFRARGRAGYVHASELFSTTQSVRDLAALLRALKTGPVKLYGASYGTYFAQYFTWRYPRLVRALVLDSAYALDQDFFDLPAWAETRFALDAVCVRSIACSTVAPGSSTVRIARLAAALKRHPIRNGRLSFDLDDLDSVLENASSDVSFEYRDLDAAARAWLDRGDAVPLDLLRRIADIDATTATSYREFSLGMETADECTMYKTPFSMQATIAARRLQYRRAVAALPSRAFDPLPKSIASDSTTSFDECLYWPAPTRRQPSIPASAGLPVTLPILMLSGDLDATTPLGDARRAQRWLGRSAHLVIVPNVGHVPGWTDHRCARQLVRAFLRAPTASLDSSCTASSPEVRTIGVYPTVLADQPAAKRRAADQSSLTESRLAALAVGAVGDVINAKPALASETPEADIFKGPGLRGGSYTIDVDAGIFMLRRVAYSRDTVVTGWAAIHLHRGKLAVLAHVLAQRNDHGVSEDLWMTWDVDEPHAMAMIDGYTHSHHFIHEEAPAP